MDHISLCVLPVVGYSHGFTVVNMSLENPEEEYVSNIRQHVCAHTTLCTAEARDSSMEEALSLSHWFWKQLRSRACSTGQRAPSPAPRHRLARPILAS